jgi:hypothetical protein
MEIIIKLENKVKNNPKRKAEFPKASPMIITIQVGFRLNLTTI